MSTMTTPRTRPGVGQKVGLVLAGLMNAINIPGFMFQPEEGEAGPPMAVLVVGSILGIIGLAATIAAWHGNQVAARIAAGALIIVTLTGLPAFFVDGVPTVLRILAGVSILWTVAAIYLMFATPRRSQAFDGGEQR